ncbi:MAG: molybdenum ABC transporter ATP-binding protein [Pseudomonadota bacterium]
MLEVAVRQQRGDFLLDARFTAQTPGVIALFGRSGCGKTTLINLLAGLLDAQEGAIRVEGETWFDSSKGFTLAAQKRRVGYVFQEARLFPHLSVRGNLLYGARRAPAGANTTGTFEQITALLGLEALLARRPGGLSGGERQRVALGRALLAQPRLLLLDEPLSSLDAARREEVLPYFERLRDACAIPMILVSHQFDEVLRLATQVIVLEGGRVVAAGDTTAVSLTPALRAIVGPDALGAVVDGTVLRRDAAEDLVDIAVGNGVLRIASSGAQPGERLRVQLLARDIILAISEPTGLSVRNQLRGTVVQITTDHDSDLVEVDIGGARILARITRSATAALSLAPGITVWVLVKAVSTRGHAFPRR